MTNTKEIDYSQIDENIQEAVQLLNMFAGMRTLSSCGGHRGERGRIHTPYNSWFIYVEFQRNELGWEALTFLNLTCENAGITLTVNPVTFRYGAEEPEPYLTFTMRGNYAALGKLEKRLRDITDERDAD